MPIKSTPNLEASARFQDYTKFWITKEAPLEKKKRARTILKTLKKTYPDAGMMLRYSTPNQLASYDPLHLSGKFGRLSFDTVTACTAWIVKR